MKTRIATSLILVTSLSFAADINYQGTTQKALKGPETKKIVSLNNHHLKLKNVAIVKVKLSKKAKNAIKGRKKHKKNKDNFNKLPSSRQLMMNHVPVADQGVHGSCATFAVIGALNAIQGQSNYSELCLLNLGKYLANTGYSYSGWDGQDPAAILFRTQEFGLITKDKQKAIGCGGETEYPTWRYDDSSAITPEDYHAMSEPLESSGLAQWTTLFEPNIWLTKETPMTEVLYRTKLALYHGNRIIISTLLPLMGEGVGSDAKFHKDNDSWVLTGQIEQAIMLFSDVDAIWGAHAMIITGYDDNAIAIDNNGQKHKGLLTLRNSWGLEAGDNGNYYMSYDYFKMLVIQLNPLITL